jgi:hypothetical protein
MVKNSGVFWSMKAVKELRKLRICDNTFLFSAYISGKKNKSSQCKNKPQRTQRTQR